MLVTNSLLWLFSILPYGSSQFNNPSGVDIWCGKAYRATNASFNPGGQFTEPARSPVPLLNFKVIPRMSIYLADETSATVLVNISISHFVGTPYHYYNPPHEHRNHNKGSGKFCIQLLLDGHKDVLRNATSVEVDRLLEIPIDLSDVPARLQAYELEAIATDDKGHSFHTITNLTKLPLRRDNGTAARVDNLHGGLAVRHASASQWQPIFPYTYYVQWSLYWYANLSTLEEFSSKGYNVIHIVPTGDLGDTPFPWDKFEPYLQRADELGLLFQYDLRWDYSNLTTMIDQVERLKSHPSMLLWYTGDEPDGKSNPINSTRIAYETIRSIDPYHPISLALNCYDFYYSDYASGAEIILSDVYPISTNTSYSTVYETPCNATYGCCGCDDCKGSFEDISDRLENFAHFDDILGWPKTHWGAPQAFGNETFWTRYPTAAEEVVMNMLSINHGATGIVMWDFPTTAEILDVTNRLAAVLTNEQISNFFIGSSRIGGLAVQGASRIDGTAWVSENQILINIINLNYGDVKGGVRVRLPHDNGSVSITSVHWGNAKWAVIGDELLTSGLKGLEVSLVLLSVS